MTELPSVEESYSVEVMRKAIHICSLSIPVIYYFISKETALSILIPLTVVTGLADVLRLYHKPTGRLFDRYLGFMLRRHERNDQGRRLNGATYVLLSATLCILIFPKVIVVTAFSILIISDTAAALFGRRFGKHRFMSKSLEGSSAFLLTAVVVVLVAPKIQYLPMEYLIGLAAALLGTVVEASNILIDDNLSIPISIGACMWALYAVLLPAINVFALG